MVNYLFTDTKEFCSHLKKDCFLLNQFYSSAYLNSDRYSSFIMKNLIETYNHDDRLN